MKADLNSISPRLITLALLSLFCAGEAGAIDADLGRFSTAKQNQIRALAEGVTNKVPSLVWRFFDAVRVDDWETATNIFNRISAASHRYEKSTNDDALSPVLGTLLWPPLSESYGAYENFHGWNNLWLHRFGKEIIGSIPPGSIYFGGTDPGRFVISALCESQVAGKPFFTLTQNQLADQTYLDYLQAMYGKKIYVPTAADSQRAFQDYSADAGRRRRAGQLAPGEDVREVNGQMQVSGQVAVMHINGLLVKKIFAENPSRNFFVEESFPLDWMYPQLSPHGLIFKLNRDKLAELSEADVAADRDYWEKLSGELLGGWLEDKTTLPDVCDFAAKYGLGKRLENYPGNKAFAENDFARKCFSKLRSSQAGMYAWRVDHAKDAAERDRMYRAADLAFRQAYACCPVSPEAIYRYVNLLLARGRTDDAVLLVKTSVELQPENEQLKNTLQQLRKYH